METVSFVVLPHPLKRMGLRPHFFKMSFQTAFPHKKSEIDKKTCCQFLIFYIFNQRKFGIKEVPTHRFRLGGLEAGDFLDEVKFLSLSNSLLLSYLLIFSFLSA